LSVDNGHRKLHGALLDAELLAEVYLAMTSGQGDLGLSVATPAPAPAARQLTPSAAAPEHRRVLHASAAEAEAHAARLARIAKKSGGRVLWPSADEVVPGA
jgi:DNA polymerase III subunit epsilon